MSPRLFTAIPAVVAGLLLSRNAAAHDRSVVVSLDGGTCVAQSKLRDAVASRGGRIADDAPVHLRVKVDPKKDGQVGVEIGGRGARGPLAERRFVASSCADATDALGLMIALAGDEAEQSAAPSEPPTAPREPTHAEGASPAAIAPPVAAPQPVAADAPATVEPPPKRGRAPSTPSRFALGAGVMGTTLGEGQIGARVAGTLEWQRSVVPWLEVAAAANVPRAIEGGGGRAAATWISGRLAVAPVGMTMGSHVHASLLAAVDAGALHVAGSGASRVESKTRPWFALAGGGRARWDLGDRWFAGLDVAAIVPLVRDDFVFLRGGSAYRVPAIGVESAICVGARFP